MCVGRRIRLKYGLKYMEYATIGISHNNAIILIYDTFMLNRHKEAK